MLSCELGTLSQLLRNCMNLRLRRAEDGGDSEESDSGLSLSSIPPVSESAASFAASELGLDRTTANLHGSRMRMIQHVESNFRRLVDRVKGHKSIGGINGIRKLVSRIDLLLMYVSEKNLQMDLSKCAAGLGVLDSHGFIFRQFHSFLIRKEEGDADLICYSHPTSTEKRRTNSVTRALLQVFPVSVIDVILDYNRIPRLTVKRALQGLSKRWPELHTHRRAILKSYDIWMEPFTAEHLENLTDGGHTEDCILHREPEDLDQGNELESRTEAEAQPATDYMLPEMNSTASAAEKVHNFFLEHTTSRIAFSISPAFNVFEAADDTFCSCHPTRRNTRKKKSARKRRRSPSTGSRIEHQSSSALTTGGTNSFADKKSKREACTSSRQTEENKASEEKGSAEVTLSETGWEEYREDVCTNLKFFVGLLPSGNLIGIYALGWGL